MKGEETKGTSDSREQESNFSLAHSYFLFKICGYGELPPSMSEFWALEVFKLGSGACFS